MSTPGDTPAGGIEERRQRAILPAHSYIKSLDLYGHQRDGDFVRGGHIALEERGVLDVQLVGGGLIRSRYSSPGNSA